MDRNLDYFDSKYIASRNQITKELYKLITSPVPQPKNNWNLVWVFSGIEYTFEEKPADNDVYGSNGKNLSYNGTRQRFETGIKLVKTITARRLNKPLNKISINDIKSFGPKIYFNGRKKHNDYLKHQLSGSRFENKYSFPSENVIITKNQKIFITPQQFEDFPVQLIPSRGKIVIVTEAFHMPRVRRYIKTPKNKIPANQIILYPSQPIRLSPKAVAREIDKIYPYILRGDLSKN